MLVPSSKSEKIRKIKIISIHFHFSLFLKNENIFSAFLFGVGILLFFLLIMDQKSTAILAKQIVQRKY